MLRFRFVHLIGVLTLFLAHSGIPEAGGQTNEGIAIIVNKTNPVEDLSSSELRRIFMIEKRISPNGRKYQVLMGKPKQAERESVLRIIYRMSEREYSRHFLRAVFTGAVQSAPSQVTGAVAMKRLVARTPGAIGYVRASEIDNSVKVVSIDGQAPGAAGYKLTLGSD